MDERTSVKIFTGLANVVGKVIWLVKMDLIWRCRGRGLFKKRFKMLHVGTVALSKLSHCCTNCRNCQNCHSLELDRTVALSHNLETQNGCTQKLFETKNVETVTSVKTVAQTIEAVAQKFFHRAAVSTVFLALPACGLCTSLKYFVLCYIDSTLEIKLTVF